MSHEIRNPLNVIIGLAEDISSEEDNNISNKNAKDIIETTKALLSTVDGILDITKIENGNKEITVTTNYQIDQLTIENNAGTILPSTGGIGTTIFYIVGGLLAVGAGVVLVSKKRMGKEEN